MMNFLWVDFARVQLRWLLVRFGVALKDWLVPRQSRFNHVRFVVAGRFDVRRSVVRWCILTGGSGLLVEALADGRCSFSQEAND
jgi:hypothetical protein